MSTGTTEHMGANFRSTMPNERLSSKFIVTCEHAMTNLPPEKSWGKADLARDLPSLHWASDPGALELAEELADAIRAPLIHSLYSRLFVDVNRPVSSSTLARLLADGQPVELNDDVKVSKDVLVERIMKYYLPYHGEIERIASQVLAQTAISVHTFTPNYEGQVREMEVGVLYSTSNKMLVERMTADLNNKGFSAKINEPWSGLHGFMHSVDCFTYNAPSPGARNAIMFEIRNDVCQDPEWRARFIEAILPFFPEQGFEPEAKL